MAGNYLEDCFCYVYMVCYNFSYLFEISFDFEMKRKYRKEVIYFKKKEKGKKFETASTGNRTRDT